MNCTHGIQKSLVFLVFFGVQHVVATYSKGKR